MDCENKMKLMKIGVEKIVIVYDEKRKKVYEEERRKKDEKNKKQKDEKDGNEKDNKKEKKWSVGGVEFEDMMRMIDNDGFRKG